MKKRAMKLSILCLLTFVSFVLASCVTTPGGTGEDPIKFVVPAAQKGGADKLTRFWIGLNVKEQYTDRKIKPVNKPGGAGGIAMQYVLKQRGDDNVVLAISNFFVTTPLFQSLPFSYRNFTPIALLANDNFVIWVPVDSPWMTVQDFLDEAKRRSIQVGGTGSKQEDEIIFRGIEQATDIKPFKYVPFKGGGSVAKALVGKHIEASVNQVSEAGGFYPDFVRPLCILQDDRLDVDGYRDIRTCKEDGIPVSYQYIRGVFAPPDISEEARVELVELFRDISDDSEWHKFTEKVGMRTMFLTGDELTKFLEDFEEVNRRILSEQGWIR